MKVMVFNQWATVGSANPETLSLRIDRELNIAFRDRAAVNEIVDAVFLPDFRKSKRRLVADGASPVESLAEAVADQL